MTEIANQKNQEVQQRVQSDAQQGVVLHREIPQVASQGVVLQRQIPETSQGVFLQNESHELPVQGVVSLREGQDETSQGVVLRADNQPVVLPSAEALNSGDPMAWEAFFSAMNNKMVGGTENIVHGQGEDAAQDAWEKMLRKIGSITDENLASWSMTVAINTARSIRRRELRRQTYPIDDSDNNNSTIFKSSENPTVEHAEDNIDLKETLAKIDQLTAKQRAVILGLAAGFTMKELADELGIPLGTVQSSSFRVRNNLKASPENMGFIQS